MSEFPLGYEKIHPTTWAYLSTLLMIGVFFKFNRLWSIRNLDLILLALLAPGLILVQQGTHLAQEEAARARAAAIAQAAPAPAPTDPVPAGGISAVEAPSSVGEPGPGRLLRWWGYVWLIGASGLWLVRLLLDPTMVRRPLLEPNLSTSGLAFLGLSLLVFLMANVVTGTRVDDDMQGPRLGPGYALINNLPAVVTVTDAPAPRDSAQRAEAAKGGDNSALVTAKAISIAAHLAIVAGLVLIGYWHFYNLQMGVGAAALYLMLPYTAEMTGRVGHVLPGALLVWAILLYRRPLLSGIFVGLAIGAVYYPLFLLPLWISFYWQRGLVRFLVGVGSMVGVLVLVLWAAAGSEQFGAHVQRMFGIWLPVMDGLQGVWELGLAPQYRIPVLAAFVALSASFALWPAQKNLGTLLSCTAAVMAAAQFWHGFGGGLYMAWYLPLLLLTVFRPNLEDRVALSVLGEGWAPRRRRPVDATAGIAA